MKKPIGRPPIGDAPATVWVGLRMTPAQRLDLQQVAQQNHTDVTGVIREAVNEYIADCRTAPPVFRLTKP